MTTTHCIADFEMKRKFLQHDNDLFKVWRYLKFDHLQNMILRIESIVRYTQHAGDNGILLHLYGKLMMDEKVIQYTCTDEEINQCNT
jgi:hypothetical protein